MDYKRDIRGEVELDEYGEPVAIVQDLEFGKRVWYADRIEERGEVIMRAKKGEDLRRRIVHLKLYGFGDTFLGITPLQTTYNSALSRLNLGVSTGEAAFRSEGLVAYVSGKPSQKTLEGLVKALKDSSSKNIFVFEDKIKLDRVPSPDIKGRERLIYAFLDEQCIAFGVPLRLVAEGLKEFAGEFEWRQIKFEMRVKTLQERLAWQVREKILRPLWETWGMKTKVPKIVFHTKTPATKLSRSRQIATLARRGLIRRDPELEKRLRQEYDLPYKFVVRELKQWEEQPERVPEESKETDVYTG